MNPGLLRARVVVLALAAICLVAVAATLLRVFVLGNRHAVIPGQVYRSAQPSPEHIRAWANELELRSIISLKGGQTGRSASRAEQNRLGQDLRVDQHFVRMSAQRWPSPGELLLLIDTIAAARRPLLLHCQAGIDRTGLASAVALLLHGDTPETASGQFGLGYGYPGRLVGSDLPEVIDVYRDWLTDNQREHTPSTLRDWVRDDYVAYYYEAEFKLLSGHEDLETQKPTTIVVEVFNRSPTTIPLQCPDRGVELSVAIRELGVARPYEREGRACGDALELAPEASLVIEVPGFRLPRPGRYEMTIDLVDNKMQTYFEDMGSQTMRRELVVD